MRLGEELWIVGPRVGVSQMQLRQVLQRVARVAGARDERELEAAFLSTLGKEVRIRRLSGAELAYTVENPSSPTER